MIQRYWSILAHFASFKLLPFTVAPWWLVCLRYSLRPVEALYLAGVVLVTVLIWAFVPFNLNLNLVADFGEVLIWCVFVFLGHSLFTQATEIRFVALAGIIALASLIDFHMLDLSITRWLAGSPTGQNVISSNRGTYILAPEASYWGLTLLGFYTYALTRRWWLAAGCFGLLIWWNQGIYQFAIFLLCSAFLSPLRVLVKFALVAIVGITVLYGLDWLPTRFVGFYTTLMAGISEGLTGVDLIHWLEQSHGSTRLSQVIRVFHEAAWLGPAELAIQDKLRAYSLLSQLLLLYGWIVAPILWALVLGLIWNRYRLQLRHASLLVVLSVATGPVSIPFVYSFLFALPQRHRPLASGPNPAMNQSVIENFNFEWVIESRRALRLYWVTTLNRLPPDMGSDPTTAPVGSKTVVLVTCGFGHQNFQEAAQRLARQASALQVFTTIHAFTDLDQVPGLPPELNAQLREYARQHPKGWGHWSWKPAVMNAIMADLPEGAEVYYLDAGCEISPLGRAHFNFLRQHLIKNSTLFFDIPFAEKHWTHPAVLAHFKRPEGDPSGQIQASGFGLHNTAGNRQLMQRWFDACQHQQGALLLPSSNLSRGPHLIDHRYDQSLLSCLIKSSRPDIIPLPQQDKFSEALYYRRSPVLRMSVHTLRQRNGSSRLEYCLQGQDPDHPMLRQRPRIMLWPAFIKEWFVMQWRVFKWMARKWWLHGYIKA